MNLSGECGLIFVRRRWGDLYQGEGGDFNQAKVWVTSVRGGGMTSARRRWGDFCQEEVG